MMIRKLAFIPLSSSSINNVNTGVSTGNTKVNTASTETSTASFSDATVYAFLSTQPQGSQLVHEDLEQIHDDDLEEMDLKWNMALLSMRARKFYQRMGRKIIIDGSSTAGYNKSKVSNDEEEVESITKVEKKTDVPTDTKKESVNTVKPCRRSVRPVSTARCVNTVRPHNTAHPKPIVSCARPKTHFQNQAQRPNVNTVRARGFNVVKPSACWSNSQLNEKGFVDSGCSRHMSGNIAHLSDFKRFDGGYVTFGGGANGGRITGKGFFVGYSLSSKAFRVYNIRTRKVQENLHVGFLENKPILEGNGPKWLFDLDSLTQSMNYVPVVAGTFSNVSADASLKSVDDAQLQDQDGTYDDCSFQDDGIDEHQVNTASPQVNTGSRVISTAAPELGVEAMQEELLQFKLQNVWVLVDLPKGHRAIGTKWVYRNKKDERGIVVRNKARLVAQGHTKKEGIDTKVLFYMVKLKWRCKLYVNLQGFEDPDHLGKVYKVVKALYGLHQAPRAWYDTLATYLLSNGFQRGKIDQTLFIKSQQGHILLVQIYVDDIIFGSTKKELCEEFEKLMKDNVKSASTPTDLERPLVKDADADDVDEHLYRSMIGSLMYLTASRPDIMFAVCALKVSSFPKNSIFSCQRIFRYLKGKPSLGLWYSKDYPLELVAYTDSDYAGATLDRKSTTKSCSLRRHLKLDDQDGITSLPTTEIFAQLALMAINMKRITKGFSGQEVALFPNMLAVPTPSASPSNSISLPEHTPSQPSPTQPSPIHPSLTQQHNKPTCSEYHPPTPHDSLLHAVHSHGSCSEKLEAQIKVGKARRHSRFVLSDTESEKVSDEVSTAGLKKGPVSEEVPTVSTAEAILSTAGGTVTYSRRSTEKRSRKDKGKAILIEEEPKKKSKKDIEQEQLSYAEAIRLEEQMHEEQRAQIARDAEIARQWDEGKKGKRAMMQLFYKED
ncbi:putative ribonuclease H-like domain-containing protein [Tanacetum coccineum]